MSRASSGAERLRIRLQGEMHDAKHVLLVRRNGCQYLGTTASRRGAGVESSKEFTPPMQFRKFKDNSEAVRRDRVRQLFEVRYAEERTETGVLLFYAWLEKGLTTRTRRPFGRQPSALTLRYHGAEHKKEEPSEVQPSL